LFCGDVERRLQAVADLPDALQGPIIWADPVLCEQTGIADFFGFLVFLEELIMDTVRYFLRTRISPFSFLGAGWIAWAALVFSALYADALLPRAFAADNAFEGESFSDQVLIRIGSHGVQPRKLSVVPGTTVLWKNEAGELVRVKFISSSVSTTCKEPRGFGGDFTGISESSKMRGGDVASLCFLEPNEYHYIVDYLSPDAQAPIEGTIHVALDH
jgi:hypothetical protein